MICRHVQSSGVHACTILVYFITVLIQGCTVGVTAQESSQFVETGAAAKRGCQLIGTEVVFLLDGSTDFKNEDFIQLKNAVATYISQSSNKSVQFAAVQFSHNFKTVFTFKDYQDGSALDYLKQEDQMTAERNTYGGMDYALNIFTNATAGSLYAQRFLIMFTHGPPDDNAEKYQNVLQRCEEKNVTVVLISVGNVGIQSLGSVSAVTIESISTIPENLDSLQEYPLRKLDVVFMFDGSLSLREDEFVKIKESISSFMQQHSGKFIQYAAVQFSSQARPVFTFKDYQDGKALSYLKNEKHMKSLTNTHMALRYILDNIFDEPTAGGRKSACKIVVIITDGNPTDIPTSRTKVNILSTYDERNITRIVIGMGSVLSLDQLRSIASVDTLAFVRNISETEELQTLICEMLMATAKVC
ncbi:hypothetical protein ACEWY4_015710 [Coilia grayii]|uniref:VWFA domain-containing protein n=1 Tax=Coilia grayii TaxID=363190 RepID=A0ABD1JNS3_9TELE